MTIEFPYRREKLRSGDSIFRPVAKVFLRRRKDWIAHYFYVDSGADYTLLPYRIGRFFGLGDVATDAAEIKGIGGVVGVRFATLEARIGETEFECPVAWAQVETLPLLLGRQGVFSFRQNERVVSFRPL